MTNKEAHLKGERTPEEWLEWSRAFINREFRKSIEETAVEGLEEVKKLLIKHPADPLKTKELLFEIVDTINDLERDMKLKEEHKNEYE